MEKLKALLRFFQKSGFLDGREGVWKTLWGTTSSFVNGPLHTILELEIEADVLGEGPEVWKTLQTQTSSLRQEPAAEIS